MGLIINKSGEVVGEVFIGYYTIGRNYFAIENLMSLFNSGFRLVL